VSMMADATDMVVIRRKATYLVGLAKRSVITKMKRLPFLEAGMGPKMSTDSSVRGPVAGSSVKGVVCRRKARRFWAQGCAHGDGGVDVRYHRRPVICLSHDLIHPVHTRMGCHCGVVLERQDAFPS